MNCIACLSQSLLRPCKRMEEIAAENDNLPTVEEVNGFLRLMDKRRFCISLNHLFSENQNWQHCLSIKCLRCGIDICF